MKALEELNNYITSKETSGALLLTGKWGCGKTHLINKFKNENQKEYAIIVISLFGIDSISLLTNRIKEQVALATFPIKPAAEGKAKKIKKPLNILFEGLSKQAKIADGLASVAAFIPIENEIGIGSQKRRLVLVFDDFERSEIKTKELLGTINEYVEAKKIKTVLVASEEKIIDDDYKEFKEKVIFRTVKLVPNYAEIIHEIIQKYEETQSGYKEFLAKQEASILQLFIESDSGNLRALRCWLIDFERVFSCLQTIFYDETIASRILYSFGAIVFEYKAGEYKAGKYGYLSSDSKLEKKYSSFEIRGSKLAALQRWITEGEWNETAFCEEYAQRFAQTDMSAEDKCLYWPFWDLNDTIVENGFPVLLEKAYNGELSCGLLMKLISKIALSRNCNTFMPQTVDYSKIEKGLDARIEKIINNEITEPELHTFITNEEMDGFNDQEKKLYKRIYNVGDQMVSYWQNRRSFIESVTAGDASAIRPLKNQYYVSFDSEMMECLYKRYEIADNETKRLLAITIKEIHFKDFMKPEEQEARQSIENLSTLKEKIEEHSRCERDSFSRIIDQNFINVISEKIIYLEDKLKEHQQNQELNAE